MYCCVSLFNANVSSWDVALGFDRLVSSALCMFRCRGSWRVDMWVRETPIYIRNEFILLHQHVTNIWAKSRALTLGSPELTHQYFTSDMLRYLWHVDMWVRERCSCEFVMCCASVSSACNFSSSDTLTSKYLVGLHRAASCRVLQCVAVCCSVLQCVSMCCSVLQCVADIFRFRYSDVEVSRWIAQRCVLQCVSAWCSVLQSVADIFICRYSDIQIFHCLTYLVFLISKYFTVWHI